MILFFVSAGLLLLAVVIALYAAFVTGITLGRTQASQMIVDLNDASYARRTEIDTKAIKDRNEIETAEQKKRLENAAEYYERMARLGTTQQSIDATFPASGKPS